MLKPYITTDITLSPPPVSFESKNMKKLDLTKEYKTYFTAKTKPELVEIETAHFISITGKGDPSGKAFSERIEVLYPVAYKIKFDSKAIDKDFVVSKLEGLWWFDEQKYTNKTMENSSTDVPRSEWEYRLLIRLPDFVTTNDFHKAVDAVVEKTGNSLTKQLEFFSMTEGKCVQMMHIGPFATEPETLKEIMKFCEGNNLKKTDCTTKYIYRTSEKQHPKN